MKKNQFYGIIILVLILIFTTNAIANANAKVTGTVVSATDKKPLISATVILHKQNDSTIVGGAITDKNGKFTISAVAGQYYIEIKYIGFENQYVNDIVLVGDKVQTLATILLEASEVLQNEITVEAEKEFVEIGIDSRKFNVTKDITAGENNVLDVLRKIPSVEVDMDDNVKMNGTTPKILIDGRESPLAEKDMLKVLGSDLVESVELITNPSAKYESEGVSGIIDIKLKKEIDKGMNAMIRAGYGSDFQFKYNDNKNLGFNANIKAGKSNIFARLSYYDYSYSGNYTGVRKTWLDTGNIVSNNFDTTFRNSYGEYNGDGGGLNGSIGIDYEFTKKDAITFNVNLGNWNWLNNNFNKYDVNNLAGLIQDYKSFSDNNNNSFNGSASLYFKKEFEEKGHNLYVDANYNNRGSNSDNSNDYFYYPILETDTLYKRLINADGENPNQSFTFKVDYEKTLELFGNLGAGIRANKSKLTNINKNYQYSYLVDDYEFNELLSDDYKFDDGVYSAYFTLGKKWASFSYRLGLRTEYTDWEFLSNAADTSFSQDYLSWMPSIHLKYMIGFKHTFGVSYSRRLSRPWSSQYNPYMRIYDSASVSVGNPALLPSYYNSYNVDYLLFTPKTTVSTAFNFNNTDNSSENYNTLTDWSGIITYPINAGTVQNFGASLSVQQKITDWWNANVYASLRHSKIAAPSLGIDTREQTSWSANASTSVKIFEKLRINSSFYYSASSITLQGSSAANYSLSVGANYSMFDDKLSLYANFSNLVFPDNPEYITFGDYFYSRSYSNWAKRSFSMGFSYKINNYQEKNRRIDENSIEGGSGEQSGGGRV